MKPQTMNDSDPPSVRIGIVFSIVLLILGVVILVVSGFTPWKAIGWQFGWILVGFGTLPILWRLFRNLANLNVVSVILLMRKERMVGIVKDKKRGKELITGSIFEWAQNPEDSTIKIKGVTLNLIFGNEGILKELIEGKNLINRDTKKIRALLLNPYSMNAITRSIQESGPFKIDPDPVTAICNHTLDEHKKRFLYRDFERTKDNMIALMHNPGKFKITIECKIYSTASPSFLLIDDQRAISENLILGKKKNEPEGKLYGMLPHFIYENGEIKDGMESHFDYIWKYDSIPIEDFHEKVEEKYYEINRLFLLYNLQKEIWERQWDRESPGRSLDSVYDILYQSYKEFYPKFSPKRILDLGCGDGGGGSYSMLREQLKKNPNVKIDFIDISQGAIDGFKTNVRSDPKNGPKENPLENPNVVFEVCDMLTFLNRCDQFHYSLVHANFSIIYMTKIKAIEIYQRIFNTLDNGGIFMVSVWTTNYFKMPISKHGDKGHRPPHHFERVPMTEDLRILVPEPKRKGEKQKGEKRLGEIRRFYCGFEELLDEFQSADENKTMDFEKILYRYYENDAILRVWVKKK